MHFRTSALKCLNVGTKIVVLPNLNHIATIATSAGRLAAHD